jgi:hypothetical protein
MIIRNGRNPQSLTSGSIKNINTKSSSINTKNPFSTAISRPTLATSLLAHSRQRRPSDLSFSLTNLPRGTSSTGNGYSFGGGNARGNLGARAQNSSAAGALIPYRTEPLYIRPSPRLSMGIPSGWEQNYFLEFAPNVAQLASKSEYVERKPQTKEEMMKNFFDDLGVEYPGNVRPKKPTKKELAPAPWEVREQLRSMLCEHEEKMEENLEKAIKYPLLIKGEIDPKLHSKKERFKKRKIFKETKEQKYVDKATEQLKNHKEKNASAAPAEKVKKDMKQMYETTRHSYHKKVAPTRFFQATSSKQRKT